MALVTFHITPSTPIQQTLYLLGSKFPIQMPLKLSYNLAVDIINLETEHYFKWGPLKGA